MGIVLMNHLSVRSARVRKIATLCLCVGFGLQCAVSQQDHKTWQDYGGGPDNSRYVDLGQINKSNVDKLTVAWSYPTNDAISYSFNPIIVGKVMYVLARGNSLVALDATTARRSGFTNICPPYRTAGSTIGRAKTIRTAGYSFRSTIIWRKSTPARGSRS